MVRLDNTGNNQFVHYIGSHTLSYAKPDEGDPQKRTMEGKDILTARARLLNKQRMNKFAPDAEDHLHEESIQDFNIHNPRVANKPQRSNLMFPNSF